jgi:hypothetical protein
MFDPINPTPYDSIYALIADPKRYHEREVSVVGYLDLGFEYAILYPHEADARLWITANGIWVTASDALWRRESELKKKYVVLTGVIDARPTPRGNPFCWCSIRDNSCSVWRIPLDGAPAAPDNATDAEGMETF